MITISKLYENYPAAHRQHMHDGHCKLIHGHNWSVEFIFASHALDECGFVIDFGKLKWLKDYLTHLLDHTMLVNEDDPKLDDMIALGLCDIRVVPNCGCEGMAAFLFEQVALKLVEQNYANDPFLIAVTVYEDSKNSATFEYSDD